MGELPRIEPINGVPTSIVDDRPFLIFGAQCDIWRSTKQDAVAARFFANYQEMNASMVKVGVPWAKIEAVKSQYDFTFLQWFIDQARTHGLKLDINLFDTNICGKVGEAGRYPQYAPTWMLNDPQTYQRMVLPAQYAYAEGGPPMCPNDPDTLEREKQLLVKIAEYLRDHDAERTVIQVQVDNEFYYQQWADAGPPDRQRVRCGCATCNARWDPKKYDTEERFMFTSIADYVNQLTTAFKQVYDIPLLVNSPWWEPYVVQIMLERCPDLKLVGIDGITTPVEPNWLTKSQVGRNIAFACEMPTESAETMANVDVLPWYTLLKPQAIGSQFWEHPEHMIYYYPNTRAKLKNALYPLKHAMTPIARARGTDRWGGWYEIRGAGRWGLREGTAFRESMASTFTLSVKGEPFLVGGSVSGAVVQLGEGDYLIASPKARIVLGAPALPRTDTATLADWRRPAAAKPADGDGDNVYGSDGYVLFEWNRANWDWSARNVNHDLRVLPAYIASVSDDLIMGYRKDNAYGVMNNPLNPGTNHPGTVANGLLDGTNTLTIKRQGTTGPFALTVFTTMNEANRAPQFLTVRGGGKTQTGVLETADGETRYITFPIAAGADDVRVEVYSAATGLSGVAFDGLVRGSEKPKVYRAEEGVFVGDTWMRVKDYPLTAAGGQTVLEITEPKVIRLTQAEEATKTLACNWHRYD